jgi:hypothetical protein
MKEDEEYKMQDLEELYGYMWLKSDVTNINADIFVDDGEAYIRDNHIPLLFVRNGDGREITEFIPISISESPTILDKSIVIKIDLSIIKQIIELIKVNFKTLMALANGKISAENFVLVSSNEKSSRYKVGDWVKFISNHPGVYVNRYADGNNIIKKEEHVGIIKNVHTITKGWYSYAIEIILVPWLCDIDERDIKQKLSDEQIKVIKEKHNDVISPVWDLHDKYDEIKIYEGGRLDYYLAKKNGKLGILDAKGNEITPVILDEVHEMIDTDGCIPLVKDGKWGLVHLGMYVKPIYDKMEIWSEEYVKVWLNGVQGWLDINGQFTTDKSQADIGSWYDVGK